MKIKIIIFFVFSGLTLQGCNTVIFPKRENSMIISPEITNVDFLDVIKDGNKHKYNLENKGNVIPVEGIGNLCEPKTDTFWAPVAAAAAGFLMDQIKKAFDQEASEHQASILFQRNNLILTKDGVEVETLKFDEGKVLVFTRNIDKSVASRLAILFVACPSSTVNKSENNHLVGIPLYYELSASKAKLSKRNWWVAWFPLFWYQLFIEDNDKLNIGVTLSLDGKESFIELKDIQLPEPEKKSCYKNSIAEWSLNVPNECDKKEIPSDHLLLIKEFSSEDSIHQINTLITETDTSNAKEVYTITSSLVPKVKEKVVEEIKGSDKKDEKTSKNSESETTKN